MTRLSFGLVASSSATEVLARFEALATWMRANASIDLVGRAAPGYAELSASVRDSTSDVAWLPPVSYAWLAEAVTPVGCIVRGGKTAYAAALVVQKSSPVRALEELRDLRAGWVDPWSAAGFVVPRLELAKARIDLAAAFRSEKFYGSHREALLALGKDECDIVGTYARCPPDGGPAIEGAWSEVEDLDVHVLATFGEIPSDVIAVRRNIATQEYELVVAAFQQTCSDAEGQKLVRAVFGGDELRGTLDPGHDHLRRAYERGIARGLFD